MKKIGVFTSGGDAPGMNTCIRAVVRRGCGRGLKVVAIKRGYCGLLEKDFVPLGPRDVANIIHTGGTFIGTSRCDEMFTAEGRKKIIESIHEAEIDALVAIGGDGTFKGALALLDEGGIKTMGVPGTIDNDVYGTDYTIGFDTAVNTALEAIDKIRDTAESLNRPFFIEVMGRRRGFIALEVGLAGGAEEILIPEIPVDIDALCHSLSTSFAKGKRSCIVVVAEGAMQGGAMKVAELVSKKIAVEFRVTILGYIQRGGVPTARDRILASSLGAAAVDAIIDGKESSVVGEIDGDIVLTPLREAVKGDKVFDRRQLELTRALV